MAGGSRVWIQIRENRRVSLIRMVWKAMKWFWIFIVAEWMERLAVACAGKHKGNYYTAIDFLIRRGGRERGGENGKKGQIQQSTMGGNPDVRRASANRDDDSR